MSLCRAFTVLMGAAIFCLPLVPLAGAGGGPAEKDWKDAAPESVGVTRIAPRKDPRTGFVVGGKNPTALLRKLTEINGRSIADLEQDMRPDAVWKVGDPKLGGEGSSAGFLGKEEKLLEVLAGDNVLVVEKEGLTHQEIGHHLRMLGEIGHKRDGKPFLYHGRRFAVKVRESKGFQVSPFFDGTQTNRDAQVTNLGSGKKIAFSMLLPEMIERYGFYEGHGTPYRLDPARAVEVLDFLKRE